MNILNSGDISLYRFNSGVNWGGTYETYMLKKHIISIKKWSEKDESVKYTNKDNIEIKVKEFCRLEAEIKIIGSIVYTDTGSVNIREFLRKISTGTWVLKITENDMIWHEVLISKNIVPRGFRPEDVYLKITTRGHFKYDLESSYCGAEPCGTGVLL